jgi:hypothetical protein
VAAAAAGTQAEKSNRADALVREQPQAATAVALIYSNRKRCAGAVGAACLCASVLYGAQRWTGGGGAAAAGGVASDPPLQREVRRELLFS